MSVTGLHPEHLLEKESLGTLDDAERKQLDAHLGQCPACRFERTVRADFADELAGEDPPVRISGVLVDAGIEKEKALVVPPPRRARFRLTWLVAAAVLLLVATAVASEQTRSVILPFFGVRTVTVVVTAPAPTNPPPPVVVNVLPQPQPTTLPVATEEPKNEVVPVVVQQTSQTIFDEESDARRRGDYERAIALHSELVTKYPKSKEAQVSRVTVARMLLDRGDAASALLGFDAYLRNGGGELSEEAMLGRATSLDRLNKNDEALAAWKTLAEQHPDGPYAAHAQVRIEALSQK